MVYSGRPSTSCDNCRAKKRRCDKAVPGCGQCRRCGQTCPGYRDPSSLIFRDQSSQVIDKARAKVAKKAASSSNTTSLVERIKPNRSGPGSINQKTQRVLDAAHEVLLEADGLDSSFANTAFLLDLFNFNAFSSGGGPSALPDNDNQDIVFGFDDGAAATSEPGSEPNQRHEESGHIQMTEFSSGVIGNDKEDIGSNHISKETIISEVDAPPPFSLPLDMMGLNFFLSHYVIRQYGRSMGFLDYTIGIMTREDGDGILESAVLALGLTGLAQATKQNDLMCRAMIMYTMATERVNKALAIPSIAQQDSTIVAVLILALYEFAKASIDGWTHHIQGAGSLLVLRGQAQLDTPVGVQIFEDVFSHLLGCLLRIGYPVPPGLRALHVKAGKLMLTPDPLWVANDGIVELLDLYQHLSPGGYSANSYESSTSSPASYTTSSSAVSPKPSYIPLEEIEQYLSQAIEIDERLETCFSECSPEWRFTVVEKSPQDSSLVHGSSYHVYHDFCVADVWHNMRTCRILANHAIGHLVLRGANSDLNWFFANNRADRLQQVSRNIAGIRADLIASVPQYLGQGASFVHDGQRKHSTLIGANPASPPVYSPVSLFHYDEMKYTGSATAAYFGTGVLLTIGYMHNLPEETRAWVVTQLRRISDEAGILQAGVFAAEIETHQLRPPLG